MTVDVSGVATQPADDLILAAAISASVDYVVTGDRQLRQVGSFRDVPIVSPREFFDMFDIADEGA